MRLMAEARVVPTQPLRRPPDGTREEGSDLSLQDAVGRQPANMAVALGFEELVE